MQPRPFYSVVGSVALLGSLLGCGADSSSPSSAASQSASAGGPAPLQVISTQGLPELGDYLPPLDDDRIEVAGPKGWDVPSRSSRYLVWFRRSAKASYPCVIITAKDHPGEDVFTVSEENAGKFADQTAAALDKDRSAVRPVRIGRFVGASYWKRGKEPKSVSKIIELLYLDTVVAGRKYSIHLRSREGDLEQDQPYLFAVADGIRFLEAESREGQTEAPRPQMPQAKPGEHAGPQPGAEQKAPPGAEPEAKDEAKPKRAPKPEEQPEAKVQAEPKKADKRKLDLKELDDLLE